MNWGTYARRTGGFGSICAVRAMLLNSSFYKHLIYIPLSKSITQTASVGSQAWWKLTFSESYYIDSIKIYNREDCCEDRMDGVTISIDDTVLPQTGTNDRINLWENIDLTGKVVKISGGNTDDSYVSLAEVQVFGREYTGEY